MGFRYAFPLGTKDWSGNTGRIAAEDHPTEEATCQCCGRKCVSVEMNGVYQWVHLHCNKRLKRMQLAIQE